MTPPRDSDRIAATGAELLAAGAIQVAVRQADLPDGPYVPSRERVCSRCGEKVWISEGGFPLADQLPIVCLPCIEETSA